MSTNRRTFLSGIVKTAALVSFSSYQSLSSAARATERAFPSLVDLYSFFKDPVILKKVEAVRTQGKMFVRTTSGDGVQGITMCNERMEYLVPILKGLVVPFFLGKDARDLENLVNEVYKDGRNYKYAGMPFSNCVGHLELSIWDMLGKKPKSPLLLF